jgi:hypothetical protein
MGPARIAGWPGRLPSEEIMINTTLIQDVTPAEYEALAEILSPITPAQFAAEYWGRKPLFLKQGLEKIDRLLGGHFDKATFMRSVRAAENSRRAGERVNAIFSPGRFLPEGENPKGSFPVQSSQIDYLIEGGATITSAIRHAGATALAMALKAALQHPGHVYNTANLSAAGSSLRIHFDAGCGFFFQCEGRKRWILSKSAAFPWPRGSAMFEKSGVARHSGNRIPQPWEAVAPYDVNELFEVVMEPGDVLYVPAGVIHGTEAIDESLAVAVFFDNVSFTEILTRLVDRAFAHQPEWRHMPPGFLAGPANGTLPANLKDFFIARLDQLRDYLSGLDADSLACNIAWQEMVAEAKTDAEPKVETPAGKPIQRGDWIVVSPHRPVNYAVGADENGETVLRVFQLGVGAVTEVTGTGANFLWRILDAREFIAEAAGTFSDDGEPFPWEVVQDFLESLRASGLIEAR